MQPARIVLSDQCQVIAYCDNVAVVAPLAFGLIPLRETHRRYRVLLEEHETIGVIILLGCVPLGIPDSATRAENLRGLRELGPALALLCLVIEGSDVASQMLRTTARALNLLVGRANIVVCASSTEAVDACVRRVSTPLGAKRSDLLNTVATVRAQAGAPRPAGP
ncbi:MAG: hypothetical protein RL701_3295 [Pseudomonadota bacterium]|jgi:hypothetical protein